LLLLLRAHRKLLSEYPTYIIGRAIAEAVSRWLPTAEARVRARVWQVEFVVDKVASGQVFFQYFGFLCQKPFTSFSILTSTRGS
jgi:hypothetical protein